MKGMFYRATSFDEPLGNWDVSCVVDMSDMFYEATSFDQPLGDWNVSNVVNMNRMFHGVTLSTQNYEHLLLGWSKLTLQKGVTFDAGNSKYTIANWFSRQAIVTNFDWTIIDGGMENFQEIVLLLIGIGLIILLVGIVLIKKPWVKR